MVEVPLTQGKIAIIDDEDAERILAYKWFAAWHGPSKIWYAHRSERIDGKGQTVRMHRFILNAPSRLQVDHINRDGLDNRRSNLRLATHAQNQRNRLSALANTLGFRGVRELPRGGAFSAHIKVDGEAIRIAPFKTAEDAARAYDLLAKHYHGEFATLNFPDE